MARTAKTNTCKKTTSSKKPIKKTSVRNKRTSAPKKSSPKKTPPQTKSGAKTTAVNNKQPTSGAAVTTLTPLTPEALKKRADLANLPASTRRVKPLSDFVGQARALAAMQTALNIRASGYNVFASGRNGLGKRTMILRLLKNHAASRPTPRDWVYVGNFKYTRKPQALSFEAGGAKIFKKQMTTLWSELIDHLSLRFRADRYLTQVDVIRKKISKAQEDAFEALTEEGKQLNLQLVTEDNRHEFVPIEAPFNDSNYVELESAPSQATERDLLIQPTNTQSTQKTSPQETAQPADATDASSPPVSDVQKSIKNQTQSHLPNQKKSNSVNRNMSATVEAVSSKRIAAAAKAEMEKNRQHMQTRLKQLSYQLENLEVEANRQIDDLNESIARDALEPLMKPLFSQYKADADIIEYLDAYKEDIIGNIEDILGGNAEEFLPGHFESVPVRYQVNIMTKNKAGAGAPVIFEDMPTHYNLIGHVEQITHMGTVTTDFSLIRAGSLHKANGGFLVLEALDLLEHPYAWQGLKRALQSKQIKLSSLEQMVTLTGSISLSPDTIPLDIKVVLLGEPSLYYELLSLEPEFNSVFKIRADFCDTMPRSADNETAYVQMIADYVHAHKLLPFKRTALAALLEDASRGAEEQSELCLHAGNLGQMLLEANSFALQTAAKEVTATHIKQALDARTYRMGYLRELYWQDLARGHQLISTTGTAVGQINALTVIAYADSEFGLPARLTATAHQGHGEILDVERDVDLAGSLHAKGMLIMASYLRSLFGQENVLSFTAALTFEQNYGQIDGDSATLAEVCALISAISGVGIDQGVAITGSMNQFGDVQPIGGVNAKIEGFFDTCKLQGLNGHQGVIMPAQNQTQLMLRDDVIEAVAAGQFHIYAISHVREALEKLLGMTCGTLNKKDNYPKGTLFAEVHEKLSYWRGENEKLSKKKSKKK